MKIEKAHFGVEGERVSLSVPLAKVDAENRIVSGFATLDNVDTQDDVVTAEASVSAFKRSKAKLREMHDKVAVGKIVSFKEDEFFDNETQKFYKGIYVDAYVSKGAPNTWEKVLDGTLAAFSIGGAIKEAETSLVKDATGQSKSVRIIKDYDLTELSLVDNGANQLANIFSITKMANGDLSTEGIATGVVLENVFYCGTDNISKSIDAEEAVCDHCNKSMENIGWIEADENRENSVKELVDKVVTTRDIKTNNEGSEKLADENKKEEVTEDATKATDVTETTEKEVDNETVDHGDHDDVTVNSASVEDIPGAPEAVEEAKTAEDEKPEEDDSVKKMIGELSEQFKTSFAKSEEQNAKLIGEIEAKLAKAAGDMEEKFKTLDAEQQKLATKINSLNDGINDVEKRLGSVEAGTAIKKSGDLGRSSEDSQITKRKESIWGGAFLGTDSL